MMKRGFDILFSGAALLVAAPLLLASALAIVLTSRGPVFFRQQRVGKDGKRFEILKLRTMTVRADRAAGQTRAGDAEVTAIGGLLRRLKVDELPQLLNVLRGEMSVVGPRPCLPQTADEMPDWARARFAVRPGLTGLAQINGNIELSWPERWQYDVRYVERSNLGLDLAILFGTVRVVLFGEAQRVRQP